MSKVDYERKLKQLGFELEEAPKPLASYVPTVRVGKLLFVSGVLPRSGDKMPYAGKVGRELTLEQGQEAARLAVLNALSAVKGELGSLNKVKRIVKLTGYVASAEGFRDQHKVVNGASDFLRELFGEKGRHSRVSVGVYELPLGAPIEIELLVQTV